MQHGVSSEAPSASLGRISPNWMRPPLRVPADSITLSTYFPRYRYLDMLSPHEEYWIARALATGVISRDIMTPSQMRNYMCVSLIQYGGSTLTASEGSATRCPHSPLYPEITMDTTP